MKKSKKNKKKNNNNLSLIGISIVALLFVTLIYQYFQLKQGRLGPHRPTPRTSEKKTGAAKKKNAQSQTDQNGGLDQNRTSDDDSIGERNNDSRYIHNMTTYLYTIEFNQIL